MPPIQRQPDPPASPSARGLAWMFGAFAFVQGVGEPTEGLIAQPVMSLLSRAGRSDVEITDLAALVALPWSLKPVFGLISDFLPLFGSRRRNYLILATAAMTFGLGALFLLPTEAASPAALLGWLLVPTAAVAFSDVVVDALMVEIGQPRRLTGRLQAVQWASMYAATIGTGLLGGWLSQHRLERYGFAVCAALSAGTLALTVVFVRDPTSASPRRSWRDSRREIVGAMRARGLGVVAAFLFLFNFNPFSDRVTYLHATRTMGLGQEVYGQMVAVLGGSCLAASLLYGLYCRRVPMRRLVPASIVLGMMMPLAYLGLRGPVSARLIMIPVGLTYMTSTLIQLDLAARVCPPQVAGTVFALLMALENLAAASSTMLGGRIYQAGAALWGADSAFALLIAVGAGATAISWLLVPWLPPLPEIGAMPGEAGEWPLSRPMQEG